MEAKCLQKDSCQYLNECRNELDSYQKCVESSLLELNNLNVKYEKTAREISSIFDLFQHINLITDYNNLYAIINDMLIGVLGVSASTMFSVSDNKLMVEASSISRRQLKNIEGTKQKLVDSGCLEGRLCIFDSAQLTDEICRSRDIKTAAAIPLMKKDKCQGIIFLEHTLENYFSEENKQFFNTLAIAVRLAIENAQLYSNLENMALRDGMTGVYSIAYFRKELQNCIQVYEKYGIPFTIAFVDIDEINSINFKYGYLCGDAVVRHVAKVLENEVRKGDIVCRCGGDQFGMIFRSTLDTNAIFDRLETIREKIAGLPIYHEGSKISFSCSFGIASTKASEDAKDYKVIHEFALEALKQAKEQGKNKVAVHQ